MSLFPERIVVASIYQSFSVSTSWTDDELSELFPLIGHATCLDFEGLTKMAGLTQRTWTRMAQFCPNLTSICSWNLPFQIDMHFLTAFDKLSVLSLSGGKDEQIIPLQNLHTLKSLSLENFGTLKDDTLGKVLENNRGLASLRFDHNSELTDATLVNIENYSTALLRLSLDQHFTSQGFKTFLEKLAATNERFETLWILSSDFLTAETVEKMPKSCRNLYLQESTLGRRNSGEDFAASVIEIPGPAWV